MGDVSHRGQLSPGPAVLSRAEPLMPLFLGLPGTIPHIPLPFCHWEWVGGPAEGGGPGQWRRL